MTTDSEQLSEVLRKESDRLLVVGKITADKLKYFIDVEVKPGAIAAQITRDHITDLLKDAIAVANIPQPVLDDIVATLKRDRKAPARRILKGTAPEVGKDGKLLILVKKFGLEGGVVADDKGRADLHQRHLFDNITKGQPLGRLYKPKPGKEGKDVFGGLIASQPGQPAKVTLEKSISLKDEAGEEYQQLVAEADGYLVEKQGKLSISSELVVDGDLDFRVGSIDFVAAVKIKGDVLPGFSIRAKTGIEIGGTVRGGTLVCTNGPIVVKGFVFGGENSRVISGDSFEATMCQEVSADIRGKVTIKKEARDSTIRAQGAALLGQAHLIGGELLAVSGAEIKVFGSEAGKVTTVRLVSDIEATIEYAELVVQIANHEKAEQLLKLHLGPYVNMPARVQLLKSPQREKMEALLKKLAAVSESKVKLLVKKKEMIESSKNPGLPRVNVTGTMYNGACIKMGDQVFSTNDAIKGPCSIEFNVEKKEFVKGELQELPGAQVAKANTKKK